MIVVMYNILFVACSLPASSDFNPAIRNMKETNKKCNDEQTGTASNRITRSYVEFIFFFVWFDRSTCKSLQNFTPTH